jgi:hypothetical protein
MFFDQSVQQSPRAFLFLFAEDIEEAGVIFISEASKNWYLLRALDGQLKAVPASISGFDRPLNQALLKETVAQLADSPFGHAHLPSES